MQSSPWPPTLFPNWPPFLVLDLPSSWAIGVSLWLPRHSRYSTSLALFPLLKYFIWKCVPSSLFSLYSKFTFFQWKLLYLPYLMLNSSCPGIFYPIYNFPHQFSPEHSLLNTTLILFCVLLPLPLEYKLHEKMLSVFWLMLPP